MEATNTVRIEYSAVAIPYKSPIDKIIAKTVYGLAAGKILDVAEFCSRTICSREEMLKMLDRGILPIDLGEDKYHDERLDFKAGSATEFAAVMTRADMTGSIGELVRLANENNRTGMLKSQHLSIAWVIRELYELDGYDHREIIRRTEEVVRAFVSAWHQSKSSATDVTWYEGLADLLEKTRRCNFAPFTVGRYLRDLMQNGVSADSIRERVEWWLNAFDCVYCAQVEAEEEFRSMDRRADEFHVKAGPYRLGGFYLTAKNKCLVRVAAGAYDVLVVENPDKGHMAIMASRLDLSRLAGELNRLEPNVWFYEARQGSLINGGLMYNENPPSRLGRSIIPIIQQHPPYVERGYRFRPKAR